MKKALMGLLVLVFVVSMVSGCGGGKKPDTAPDPAPSTITDTPTPAAETTKPEATTPEPAKPEASLPPLAGEEISIQYRDATAKITIPDGWSHEMINLNRVIMYDMPAKDKYERTDHRLEFSLGSKTMQYLLAKAGGDPVSSVVVDGYELEGVLMTFAGEDGFEYMGPIGDDNSANIAVVGFALDETVILQIINSISFSIG